MRQRHERIHIFGCEHHGHALLRFGNGQLGAVETVVLARHGVQVDGKPVGQFADGHGNAAGAKVVAALDAPCGFGVAEQPLQLAFLGSVALLHLRAAGLQRMRGVRLAGAGRAAAAVATRAPAQQHHAVARGGRLAAHVLGRGRAHHRADLHALGGVAGVVNFIHQPRGQTDLVAVGTVPRRRRGGQHALGQLAFDGVFHRLGGVGRAGDAHGLIDVAAPGERVADGAADAGGRAAEGLDLRGVVVRLVLEQQQPLFHALVRLHVQFHRAGVDLLGFVQIGQCPGELQIARAHRGHVHQRHGPVAALERGADLQIAPVGLLHARVVKAHVGKLGEEGRVAAVIGPVGVDHANFRQRGVAALGLEVLLAKRQIGVVHRQPVLAAEGVQLRLAIAREALHDRHGLGQGVVGAQRLRLFQRSLAAFHGVDDVLFERLHILVGKVALEDIHQRRAHDGALALGHQLYALGGGVGALVKLSRQVLRGKDHALVLRQFVVDVVQLRLGKDAVPRLHKQRRVQPLHVVAVEQAQPGQVGHAEEGARVLEQRAGLVVKAGLFFHKQAVNHGIPPLPAPACRCPSA